MSLRVARTVFVTGVLRRSVNSAAADQNKVRYVVCSCGSYHFLSCACVNSKETLSIVSRLPKLVGQSGRVNYRANVFEQVVRNWIACQVDRVVAGAIMFSAASTTHWLIVGIAKAHDFTAQKPTGSCYE